MLGNRRLYDYVVARLRAQWSPEQIAYRIRRDHPDDQEMAISHETIYQAFYLAPKGRLADLGVQLPGLCQFFLDNDSPFVGIRRLGPGKMIEISAQKEIKFKRYFDVSELVSPTGEKTDYLKVADEMQTIARNLESLSVRTATVYLSGGRDSRMTAGMWLSSGSDARVLTLGTLEREAEIAQDLMEKFSSRPGQKTEHVVQVARGSDVTQSLPDRVALAFRMWDGDAAATNIKRNIPVPTGRATLSIGGVGGEIMHGYYYSRPGVLERVRDTQDPYAFVLPSFGSRYLTEEAAAGLYDSFAELLNETIQLKLDNPSALDYLYMKQKLRRWSNQALTSTSAIMLGSPAFIRGCFNLEPEEKVAKAFPVHLVETAIPEWSQAGYYKASPEDSKKLMKRGLASFQTDPEGFRDLISRGSSWKKYLKTERIESFLGAVERDEATYSRSSPTEWCFCLSLKQGPDPRKVDT